MLKASVRTIAVYQLVSAAAFALMIGWFLWSGPTPLLTLFVYALFVLFNLFAGIESLRGRLRGYWAGFLNELLQIRHVVVPGFAYDYVGLGQASLTATINPQAGDWLFGVSAEFLPGTFLLWFGGDSNGADIGTDVISIVFAGFLWKVLHGGPSDVHARPAAPA